MSEDEVSDLKKKNLFLEEQLKLKSSEVLTYRQQLIKMSRQLDSLMSEVSSDVEILAKLQKILTPTEIPHLPGFEISRKFVYGSKSGGDYFDFFETKDKFQFGFLVSASSNYNMSSLFLSLILKMSHVLEAKKGSEPHQVLQKMSAELASVARPQDQTHVFYAMIDRRNFTMNFSSAGQINGYYLLPDKSIRILKSSTGPLGTASSESLKSVKFELEPHSRLCVVTGGIADILGSDQIAQIMTGTAKQSVHDLRNELFFQSQRKSGLPDPERDQTVVVIDVKDQLIKLAK